MKGSEQSSFGDNVSVASPVKRYFVKFVLVFSVLQALRLAALQHDFLILQVEHLLAWSAGQLYGLILGPWTLSGNILIHVDVGRFVIVGEPCTGLSLTIGMMAAIAALPAPVVMRLLAMIAAVVCMQLFNCVRIAHLFYLVLGDREVFEFYHLYLWQAANMVLMMAVLAMSAWWMKGTHKLACHAE